MFVKCENVLCLSNGHSRANLANASTHQIFPNFQFEIVRTFLFTFPILNPIFSVYIDKISISHTFLFILPILMPIFKCYLNSWNLNIAQFGGFGKFSKSGKCKMAIQKHKNVGTRQTCQTRQFCKNLPNAMTWYSPKCSHLPKRFFEKNDIGLAKFARVMSKFGKCCSSGHCLSLSQMNNVQHFWEAQNKFVRTARKYWKGKKI